MRGEDVLSPFCTSTIAVESIVPSSQLIELEEGTHVFVP